MHVKPMKSFLNKVASRYKKMEDGDVAKFEKDFLKACEELAQKLPPKPFAVRGQFNTSIFDSIFCTVLKHIDHLPEDLKERYERLVKDQKFVEYTTLGTTDTKVVKARFEYVERLIIG